jgi:hypothetical protein
VNSLFSTQLGFPIYAIVGFPLLTVGERPILLKYKMRKTSNEQPNGSTLHGIEHLVLGSSRRAALL